MLRISKLADYGTVVMVYLANCDPVVCNARDIARCTHLSLPTVSKVLKCLTAAGLLISFRGTNGGYGLQRSPSEISVLQIIDALEEQRGLIECRSNPHSCALQLVCHIQGNWRLISQAIEAALDSVSLFSLAKPGLQAKELEVMLTQRLSATTQEIVMRKKEG